MATDYKFGGSKTPGDGTNRLVLEGTSVNPDRYVDVGGTIELSDDEVKELRERGFSFTKTSDSGDDEESASSEPDSRAAQQAAQEASGAQHPAATSDKDNTPAGRQARSGK